MTLVKHSCCKNNEDKSKAALFCLRKSTITLVSRRSFNLICPFFPNLTLIFNTVHSAVSGFPKTTLQILKLRFQFLRAITVSSPNFPGIFKVFAYRERSKGEYSFPHRNFLRYINKKPTAGGYFNSLFQAHVLNIPRTEANGNTYGRREKQAG